jgi:nucleoside diphosphate kinase
MEAVEEIVKIGEKEGLKIGDLKMKDKIVCLKLFCKQKHLLKNG